MQENQFSFDHSDYNYIVTITKSETLFIMQRFHLRLEKFKKVLSDKTNPPTFIFPLVFRQWCKHSNTNGRYLVCLDSDSRLKLPDPKTKLSACTWTNKRTKKVKLLETIRISSEW